MNRRRESFTAAIVLFYVAPLVAEYLLGDLTLMHLSALAVLAPLYGGAALLIREFARSTGRGWPAMFLLGAAFTLVAEGFTTQSLFNPDYLGMHLHLLAPAWIAALGIGAWWTVFMLNVHTFWSMGVSIALVEGLVPSRAEAPWLGKWGTVVVAVLFVAGVGMRSVFSLNHNHFVASTAQFAVTAVCCVALIGAAFLVPMAKMRAGGGWVPAPWVTGIAVFVLGMVVLKVPVPLGWGAVVLILAIDGAFLAALAVLARRQGWSAFHTLSVGAGGAVAYGVNAFFQRPVMGGTLPVVVLGGHFLFFLAAVVLITVAAKRTRGWVASTGIVGEG